ncbi:MAG: hypothetical protein LBQ68_07925, partial [Clostridiales bacterium]|nr:hypothetical protein [Clostridiales bacterium]
MINIALLKEQLKRFWLGSALIMIAYLITVILPAYFDAQDKASTVTWLISLFSLTNPFVIVLTIFAPLAAVLL